MAISTIGTHFMRGTAGTGGTLTWAELFKFKSGPDMGGTPELLDTTTQADHARTGVLGLEANDTKTYTLNYDADVYDTIKALEGQEINVSEWLGDTYDANTNTYTPTGSYGKFTGKGYISVYRNGGDVNTVRDMTVSLAMTVPFVKETT